MLQALDRLSGVGVRVIKASKDATIDAFQQLQPVLTELAASGDDFVYAFNVFLTYPFVDEVVGRDPQVARNLHMGDYTNLSIKLDLEVADLAGSRPPRDRPAATSTRPRSSTTCSSASRAATSTSKACQQGAGQRRAAWPSCGRSAPSRRTGTRTCASSSTACPVCPTPSGTGGGGDHARPGCRRAPGFPAVRTPPVDWRRPGTHHGAADERLRPGPGPPAHRPGW